jgi:integrase
MPKKRSPGEGALFPLYNHGCGEKVSGKWPCGEAAPSCPKRALHLYRAVVDVGFHPDGRRKQKYVYGKTQAKARDKLREVQKEIAEHGAPLDKNVTVEQWARHWLDTVCRPEMKPKGLASYTSCVNKWIIPTIGKKRLAQLRPSDLREVYGAIDKAGLVSMGAKAHTVMSSMLESARLDGAIRSNLAKDVIPPKEHQSERGALATSDALAVLATAAQHEDGTRWWTALLAGIRQGERVGATLDSLDLVNHEFTVQWSLTEAKFEHGCGEASAGAWPCGMKRGGSCPQRRLILSRNLTHRPLDGRLILVRPKSGKPRTFPLIPQLEAAIVRYLEATADRPNPHGLIWRNEDGSPITGKQDQVAWRNILLEAGLITEEQAKEPKDRAPGTPDIPTTHWARHTTATVLMELGVDTKIVAAIVGHVDEDLTRRRYQHVSSDAARAAMEALGGHFAKALGQSSSSS